MKTLNLEYPIDAHLKPVKDYDGNSTNLELSKTNVRIKDLDISDSLDVGGNTTCNRITASRVEVSILLDADKFSIAGGTEMTAINDTDALTENSATALATQQSIKAYIDNNAPSGAYSTTVLKVMPTEFMINDDYGSGRAANIIENDTADTLGYRMANAATEGYAFVKIPEGYKATRVTVHASASTSNAVECKTFNYTTGATTDLETFDFNTDANITDVTASTTNDLVIKILPASTSTIIYGALVSIAVA